MSLKERIEAVLQKLENFRDGIDDRSETTPSILRNVATFIEDELEDLINAVAKAADEAGSLEERIEELENEQEDEDE